jgi:hypothetical protein
MNRTPRIAHLVQLVKGVQPLAASTAPHPSVPQTITLKGVVRLDAFDGSEFCELTLNGKEIFLGQSLKFRSHSFGYCWGINWNDLAASEKACLQLSLAICIKLYGVSNALLVYHQFSRNYIECCPFMTDFEKTLTVEI